MQLNQVQQAVHTTPKGSNIVLEWVRDMDTRKGVEVPFSKSVRMIGRIGINYDNMAAVQDKRENGELPAENAGLPWGKWSEYPWLIEHKDKHYVRLYNGTSASVKPEVHFFKSGVETTLREIEPAYFKAMDKAAEITDPEQRAGAEKLALKLLTTLMASEVKSEKGETFTCKVENMTRIHSEAEWINLIVAEIGQETILVAQPVPSKELATL
jgi:hypothetical protein